MNEKELRQLIFKIVCEKVKDLNFLDGFVVTYNRELKNYYVRFYFLRCELSKEYSRDVVLNYNVLFPARDIPAIIHDHIGNALQLMRIDLENSGYSIM